MTKEQKKRFEEMLLSLRDRVSNQVNALKGDALTRSDEVNPAEDGSDAFERQFALTLASSEVDSLFEIDEALRRLHAGTYGACEDCSELIKEPRLRALPFVRKCIQCQSQAENGNARFRLTKSVSR